VLYSDQRRERQIIFIRTKNRGEERLLNWKCFGRTYVRNPLALPPVVVCCLFVWIGSSTRANTQTSSKESAEIGGLIPVESLKFGSLLLLNKAVTLSAMASNTGGALVKGETDGEGEKGEGDEEGEGEGDEESEGQGR